MERGKKYICRMIYSHYTLLYDKSVIRQDCHSSHLVYVTIYIYGKCDVINLNNKYAASCRRLLNHYFNLHYISYIIVT